MRAVRGTGEGVALVDAPEPTGDGVRVQIKSSGICGTDLSMVKAGPSMVVLGHEMAGVLDDGRPVAVEPLLPCWSCDQCRAGRYHLCRRGIEKFIGIGADGGMADAIVVPPTALVHLPAALPVADACLIEPLAVVLHGLRRGAVTAGQRVAVVGAGSIGLLAAAGAVALGCEVGLVSRHPAQTAAGERLGARPASGEYDVVLECAGSDEAVARAVGLCAPAATLVCLSTYWGLLPLPGIDTMMKELTVVGSITYNRHAAGRDVDAAASLLAADPEIAATVITHRFPLDDAAEAFRVAADRAAGAIKVVLEP